MNPQYEKHIESRKMECVPPLPLNAAQVEELCKKILDSDRNDINQLKDMLAYRVSPGVSEAAAVKANFLTGIIEGKYESRVISIEYAFKLLGTMAGGFNVISLISLLTHETFAGDAAAELKKLTLIFDIFDDVVKLVKNGNENALELMNSWAEAEWFTTLPQIPQSITLRVYKVNDVVNNDDLSPPKFAATRSDIPLHARTLGGDKFADLVAFSENNRAGGCKTTLVAPTIGVGSSRKSAVNSLMWNIGDNIDYVPNKRAGGIILAETIAPVFLSTFIDSGGLPLICDTSKIVHGMQIRVDTLNKKIFNDRDELITEFLLNPIIIPDAYRAGGRVPLIIGKKLTQQAREFLALPEDDIFIKNAGVSAVSQKGFTLAQKIIGKACGKEGVVPGEYCEPVVSSVGSQDATGQMTCDELTELSCLKFKAPLTFQSFCHTAAYPNDRDLEMQRDVTGFITSRSGVAIKPGDGIIHSWLNRMLLPDTVVTGADSHVHYPMGVSFPAGSGLVAFAATMGFMPLEVPESVLITFEGSLKNGITIRDVVNYIALNISERYSKSPLNGKIIEYEGYTENLNIEQAFELSAASAERSAAACSVKLSKKNVSNYLRSNVALLQRMLDSGYQESNAISERLAEMKSWLENQVLFERDADADFAQSIRIDLSEISEPVIAAPKNTDNACWLSQHSQAEIDEVFVGSCMSNIGHFRAVAKILEGKKAKVRRLWIVPPTRMDMKQLESEGIIDALKRAGARIEVPGCSLCMGNQARSADNARIFSNSTKNMRNRMGNSTSTYLGSAELAGVVALLGRIPAAEEYRRIYDEAILPNYKSVYRCLDFS